MDALLFLLQLVWLQEISKYLIIGKNSVQYVHEQKKKLILRALRFYLIQGKLYHQGQDQVLKHCLQDSKIPIVLQEMHEGVNGGHFSSNTIVHKILDAKYWWSTMHKDVSQYTQACDNYQRIGNLIHSNIVKMITSLLA